MLSPEELEMLFLRGKTRFQTYELEARPSKSVVSRQQRPVRDKGPLSNLIAPSRFQYRLRITFKLYLS